MRLARWCPLVIAALLLWAPQLAVAQTGGYTVTATLDPVPPLPDWWGDDDPPLLTDDSSVVRGADGYLYAMRQDYDDGRRGYYYAAITQINPTTGAARVLYVLSFANQQASDLFPGQGGRLYFTLWDTGDIFYAAPGHSAYVDCTSGCVLYVDTLHNADLKTHWNFYGSDEYGTQPEVDIFEDTDGNIYVRTEQGECFADHRARDGGYTDVKISFDGRATAYHWTCPGELPFDWSTVQPSGNNIWHWTDDREYFISGQGVYQHDRLTDATVLLASIASTDGSPRGLTEASGYLYGITRGGGALGGGVIFRIRVPSLASPDLIVTALSNPPTTAAPGALFSVSDTTLNNGPEPAALSRNAYYLSRDGTLGDIRLVNGRYLPELWPGEESSGARSVRIPATTATGVYWLMACADNDVQVAESDNANNCFAAESQITIGHPDLRQIGISTTAAFASPGGKIAVNDSVDNPSTLTAIASTTRYYISPDQVKNAGDVLLTGKRAIPELSPGEVSAGNATLTLPLSVPNGTYYVLACADDLVKIKEVSETNNCAASATTALVGWADLVTTYVSNPPPTAIRGGKFTISDTVRNDGTIPAAATYTRYYLSGDGVKDAGDVLLTGSRPVGSLAAGASSPGSRRVTVPLSTPLGTYRVLACADDTSKVAETDNVNNCRASTTTVTIE